MAFGFLELYRCPTHGLMESPTWHDSEIPEEREWYCPINLTGRPEAPHEGITDEVCGKAVELVSVGARVTVTTVQRREEGA